MRRILVCLCVAAALAAWPGAVARAQHLEPAIPRVSEMGSFWPGGQVMGQMDVFADNDFTMLGFHAYAWGRVLPAFALEGTVGFVHLDAESNATTATNPTLSAYYVHETPRTMVRVGAGIAPPLLDDEDGNLGRAYWLARGLRDAWQFVPHHASFIPSFRIDGKSRSSFAWGADAEVGMLLPTDDGGELDLLLQGGADVTAIVHPVFHLGARAQLGWFATNDATAVGPGGAVVEQDDFQLSMVPFMRFVFGAAFVEGRFVINIDEPAGFSFDDDRLWLLQLQAGGRF